MKPNRKRFLWNVLAGSIVFGPVGGIVFAAASAAKGNNDPRSSEDGYEPYRDYTKSQ